MRIYTIDSSGQPIIDAKGKLGIVVEDQRLAELDEYIGQNCVNLTGKRYGARDAAEPVAFLRSQLAALEAKAYEKQYEPLKYEDWLGAVISSEAGEHATTVDHEVIDYTGQGQWVDPMSDDLPAADSASALVSKRIGHAGIFYQYSNQELRTAAAIGRPLVARKQEAAIRGYKRHANSVALYGDTQKNFPGLFVDAAVTATTRPSAAVWDAATAATILSDINSYIAKINEDTDGNSWPTYLALPPASIGLLAQQIGTSGTMTLMRWIQEQSLTTLQTGKPFKIVPGGKFLNTANAAGTGKRGVFFDPIDENMVLHIPMPVKFSAPQMVGLNTKVYAEWRLGGLNKRRPLTVRYMDTI